jgi:hypothetical protein
MKFIPMSHLRQLKLKNKKPYVCTFYPTYIKGEEGDNQYLGLKLSMRIWGSGKVGGLLMSNRLDFSMLI